MNGVREHSGWVGLPLTVAVIALIQTSPKCGSLQHFAPDEAQATMLPRIGYHPVGQEGAPSLPSEGPGRAALAVHGLADPGRRGSRLLETAAQERPTQWMLCVPWPLILAEPLDK